MRRIRVHQEEVMGLAPLIKAARRSARASATRLETQRFMCEVELRCSELSEQLLSNQYIPGAYQSFMIHDPKPRWISAAPFQDRVVHHSLCTALEPRFESYAYDHSYACRQGKGLHKALQSTQYALKWGKFALKLDIEHFFETLPHQQLKSLVRRLVKGDEVLRLCDLLISHVPCGKEIGYGLPIGNLTSQHFANLYLGQLDHWVNTQKGLNLFKGDLRYFRYMDDLLFVAQEREVLCNLESALSHYVMSLGLRLKRSARELVPVSEGVSFLGCRLWPEHRRLDGSRRRRLFRRLKFLSQSSLSDDELQVRLGALSAWADQCGARSLLYSWYSRRELR